MSWLLTIFKAILFFLKSFRNKDLELKRFKKKLQEIKNEMAKTTDTDALNYLDAERLQLVEEIADIRKRRQKSYTFTKK